VLVTTRTDSPLADADGAVVEPEQLRRATLASSVGSALEYYDFYIYGLASALIFGPLFFKPLGDDGALIASFATYGVGFAARPFGGIIFGFIGDRFGRKMVLLLTIGLMGAASFAIGLLPTFEQAGMLGAILLVTLRILQGLGAGAEQAGATTLISEVAPRRRRGFFASLPFVGIQLGTLLGAGTFALIAMADKAVLEGWLWRVPFLASVFLIAVAVFIRLRLKETPVFPGAGEAQERRQEPHRPAVEALQEECPGGHRPPHGRERQLLDLLGPPDRLPGRQGRRLPG
jgi:MHS family metabolite:H+ symporter-like MFS transporter